MDREEIVSSKLCFFRGPPLLRGPTAVYSFFFPVLQMKCLYFFFPPSALQQLKLQPPVRTRLLRNPCIYEREKNEIIVGFYKSADFHFQPGWNEQQTVTLPLSEPLLFIYLFHSFILFRTPAAPQNDLLCFTAVDLRNRRGEKCLKVLGIQLFQSMNLGRSLKSVFAFLLSHVVKYAAPR